MITEWTKPILVILSCFMLLLGSSWSVTDTLLQGQKLKDGDQLVSASGIFLLRFFRSDKHYLGIWYNMTDEQESINEFELSSKVVWVANRNNPIVDKSGILTIGRDGNLKISYGSGGDNISLTSVQKSGNNTNITATLLDSGNLVLRELYTNRSASRLLWQSFDYPTHALFPGMKIGINLQTGHSWSLTSWINTQSPAIGSFTFGMDRNGMNQLIIWWAGDVYWISGNWVDGGFKFWHMLSAQEGYHFRYFSNENETYFTYNASENAKYFPMLWINDFGLSSSFARPLISCRSQYDYMNTIGCVQSRPICPKKATEFEYETAAVSGDSFKFNESDHLSLDDCLEKCLRNCSCVAYSPTNEIDGTGCEIWSKVTIESSADGRHWRPVFVLKSEEKKWVWWLVIAAAGSLIITLLLFSCYLLWRKFKEAVMTPVLSKFKEAVMITMWSKFKESVIPMWSKFKEAVIPMWSKFKEAVFLPMWFKLKETVVIPMWSATSYWLANPEHLLQLLRNYKEKLMPFWRKYKEILKQYLQSMKKTDTDKEMLLHELGMDANYTPNTHEKSSHELQFFKFETVASATNNFASTNKLGQGGYGPVYKGKLPDGQEVAMKRLSTNSRQGSVEFGNEIKVIAKLQHNNLVRLVGCCIEKEEKILIYEYMPNKSLDLFLFDPIDKNVLDWRKRFNIIEGIIQGLLYLHKYSRLKIIHRDLKAGNILLDSKMNPKISDFGMARIFGSEETKANTNTVVGTYGYMSPEYAMEGIFSTKSDVFSFGVLLLEIVSGKKNNSFQYSDGPLSLIAYAWNLWIEERVLELTDPIIGDPDQTEVLRCIHIGLLCVQENPMDRPSMLDVTSMIYNEANQLPSPNQPAFYYRKNFQYTEILEQKQDCLSQNGVSISEMEAR
ncbi:G-type lectin S-receptor-like serine/threonine-protein kinase CES101 isoform X2 [Ricinus communis]|uniref:G-type lectin S-receptor-like serine/threonine-protein kinase CES101 isoform X2 n=1 Tax=Ricinus communis TaxID=3988 RepID=UPI000D6953E7|nr:G-type lectin S-receptor-like serine/threonine-protein kinase CES101 isoform X2 [Ricinus communis]|eukprot:XP_015572867.2 G-type lectin S-receptor-like serine/threonine-protein kinase CES101 [Ricinus communis]